MAPGTLVRRNGMSLVSIKCRNLHFSKEGVILLCQSILEARRISHLHGSPLFTIPLKLLQFVKEKGSKNRSLKYTRNNFFEGAIGSIYLYTLLSVSKVREK